MTDQLVTYFLGVIGAWIFSDGLYSILLYLNKPGYNGPPQTWRRDHWIRCIRMFLGFMLIAFGGLQFL